jgi:CHAP domain/Putative peptidoglycan binding domain
MPSPTRSRPFPGSVISAGSTDSVSVRAIQKRLNKIGCGPVLVDAIFGAETSEAVELFQARRADHRGVPLVVDGIVGAMTWAALFGGARTLGTPNTKLRAAVLKFADSEVGTMEKPAGSNRGPKVDEYLRSVGLNPAAGSFPWCAAFVYWCFQQAAKELKVTNPAVRTAGVLDLWNRAGNAGVQRIAASEAIAKPSLVKPGLVFVLSTGAGNGHTGFVESVDGVVLTTIEGNTNLGGSREGVGVFRRTGRKLSAINRGFINYG